MRWSHSVVFITARNKFSTSLWLTAITGFSLLFTAVYLLTAIYCTKRRFIASSQKRQRSTFMLLHRVSHLLFFVGHIPNTNLPFSTPADYSLTSWSGGECSDTFTMCVMDCVLQFSGLWGVNTDLPVVPSYRNNDWCYKTKNWGKRFQIVLNSCWGIKKSQCS